MKALFHWGSVIHNRFSQYFFYQTYFFKCWTASIKTVYKNAEIARQDVYRVMPTRRQGADARVRMLRMHVRRGNPGSQDRQAGTSKQHRSLHLLNAQKRLRSRNQAKEELMTTYARFIGSVEFSENKKRKRDLKFI
jgi:hypothetical protein